MHMLDLPSHVIFIEQGEPRRAAQAGGPRAR